MLSVSAAASMLTSEKMEIRMAQKKRPAWALLNPLSWIEAVLGLFATLFRPLLKWLGMLSPPSTEGFKNTQVADVEDEARDARNAEAAIDAIICEKSAAEIVKAYAMAGREERATMDLSVLETDAQDWLLGLSEDDLTLMGMSNIGGCARSLKAKQVLPSYSRPRDEKSASELLLVPDSADEDQQRRQHIAERFREVLRLPLGISNADPRYIPGVTFH